MHRLCGARSSGTVPSAGLGLVVEVELDAVPGSFLTISSATSSSSGASDGDRDDVVLEGVKVGYGA